VILSVAKQSERECVGATRLKSQFFVNFGMLSAKGTRYTIALDAYGLRHGYRLYRGISFRRHGTLCEQHDILTSQTTLGKFSDLRYEGHLTHDTLFSG
jgi:hypothetical protein